MGRRDIQDVHSEPAGGHHGDGAVRETHPAFAVATVSRSTGGGISLFQSDLLHNETITLRIKRADRTRDLNRDWVFGKEELIEVEMSLAQWGALISSQGIGAGTPVTLRWHEGKPVPEIPFHSRISENLREVKGSIGRLLERARKSFTVLEDAIEGKKGVKATREALRTHKAHLASVENNAAFAVTSLKEAAEDVTSQAKADIESHILRSVELTGLRASVDLPVLGIDRATTVPEIDVQAAIADAEDEDGES